MYAQSETTPVDIRINGEPQLFSNHVLVDGQGNFLAPMAEFFQKTGIQYDVSDDGEMIAFRDNIFIKFRPNHITYALNGKELTWDFPPEYREGFVYVSLTPFLRYTDLRASFDAETQTLDITSGLLLEERRTRDLMKRVDIPGSQISLSVPYFWERIDKRSFRLNPRLGNLTFEVQHRSVDPAIPMRELIDLALEEFSLPADYRLSESRETFIGNHTFYTKRYRGAPDPFQILHDETPPDIPYLSISHFRIGDLFYTFVFRSALPDINSQTDTEVQILASVTSKIFSVDTLSEHYIEYGLFKALGTFIETPLYSNMKLSNELSLRGTIDPKIEELEVTILRQERSYHYIIPVRNGFFDETVPVPFGLGFHRLILSAPGAEIDSENGVRLQFGSPGTLLLKCSLINLSETETVWLSPSKEILSRDPRILASVQHLKNDSLDYQKAFTLFRRLKEDYTPGEAQTMREALEEKSGHPYTLNLIYAAQLRAAGIQARLVLDEKNSLYHVEFFSNGEWIPTDPAGYIAAGTESEYTFFRMKNYDQKKMKILDI